VKRVHQVCTHLRKSLALRSGENPEPCEQCPASFKDPDHGIMFPGCYMLAREFVRLARTGSIWTPAQRKRQSEFRDKTYNGDVKFFFHTPMGNGYFDELYRRFSSQKEE
jgi:hypothetical protein